MTTQKQSALQTIEEKKSLIAGIADKVWEFAELSLQEDVYKRQIIEPLLVATAIYFCLCFPTSKLIAYFERRMSHGDKR